MQELFLDLPYRSSSTTRTEARPRPSRAAGSFRTSGARRQKRRLMNKGLLLASDVSVGAAPTHPVPSPGGTALTTFHRSLTRESTLRMSACSVPPLIPPADRGRCPHCLRPTLTCSLRPGRTSGLGWRTLPRPETHTPHQNHKANRVHTYMVTTVTKGSRKQPEITTAVSGSESDLCIHAILYTLGADTHSQAGAVGSGDGCHAHHSLPRLEPANPLVTSFAITSPSRAQHEIATVNSGSQPEPPDTGAGLAPQTQTTVPRLTLPRRRHVHRPR